MTVNYTSVSFFIFVTGSARLDDAGEEIPDMLTDTDDLPEVDMDRRLRVTFGKELPYAPTLT